MSSLILDEDQAPGYCSVATPPLTAEQISRIVSCATTGNATAGVTVVTEKELGIKGNRKLHVLDTKERAFVVEYAGVRKAKFVKKDLTRFRAMIAAYEGSDDKDVTNILLLKDDGKICRRNTLPALHDEGVVVMRCPASTDTDSDSDESSSSDSD
jgi:hypothetical protein